MKLSDIVSRLNATPAPAPAVAPKGTATRFETAVFDVIQRDHCTKTRAKTSPSPDNTQIYLRCSELPKFVEFPDRMKDLRSLRDLTEAPKANVIGAQLNFDVGHAVHGWWQNQYLTRLTGEFTLWGHWRCGRCDLSSVADGVVKKKPVTCSGCGCSTALSYEEVTVRNDKLRLSGHPDALLGEDKPKMIGEIKTIGSDRWEKINGPPFENRVQTHAYMFATGLREVVYCYVDKGKQSLWRRENDGTFTIVGEPRVKFFHEEFDSALGQRIEDTLKEFWAIVAKLPA